MRFAKFYTLLIVLIGTLSWANTYRRGQDTLGVAGLMGFNFTFSVDRESFDKRLEALKKHLTSIKDPLSRLDFMRQTLNDIQAARALYPMLDDDEEIYMNLVVHSLEVLPNRPNFFVQGCPLYKRQMLSNFEPTAFLESGEPGQPEDPAIAQSLEIMNLVCR